MSLTVAIQYPSFGPQHPPRLEAIARASPEPDAQVVAMEMFSRDSDYEWARPARESPHFRRVTVLDRPSAAGRRLGAALRRAVFSALDHVRPDVLVVNGWGHPESRLSLGWLRRSGTAWVLLCDSSRSDRRRFLPLEGYKRWLLRGCRAAFAAGTPQARYAARLGVPAAAIFHPGSCVVDNAAWAVGAEAARADARSLRERFGLPERYFLAVARFIPKKNLPFLVEAFARFRKLGPASEWGLVLCGSGPEEGRIRSTVRRLGLDRAVRLAGRCAPAELAVHYGLAGCFVMPSERYEQWGLVVNEAAACGLPVLASRRCGAAEDLVREGESGFLFDPDDSEQLAGLMTRIARDPELRRRLGEGSRRLVEGHSLEVGAANLWRAVAAALAGRGGRR